MRFGMLVEWTETDYRLCVPLVFLNFARSVVKLPPERGDGLSYAGFDSLTTYSLLPMWQVSGRTLRNEVNVYLTMELVR